MKIDNILLKFICLFKSKFYKKTINKDTDLNKYLDLEIAILSGVIQRLLENNNWEADKWIDDILVRDIEIYSNNVYIKGNVIYGKLQTSKEWVSPLLFGLSLNETWDNYINYKCYFDTMDGTDLDYIEYRNNRKYWNLYFKKNYNSHNSLWKYFIEESKLNT